MPIELTREDGYTKVVDTVGELEDALAEGWQQPDTPKVLPDHRNAGGGAELDAANERIKGLEQELQDASSTGDRATADLASANEQLAALRKEVSSAKGTDDRAAAALKKARDEAKAEKKRADAAEQLVAELQQQLSEATEPPADEAAKG